MTKKFRITIYIDVEDRDGSVSASENPAEEVRKEFEEALKGTKSILNVRTAVKEL